MTDKVEKCHLVISLYLCVIAPPSPSTFYQPNPSSSTCSSQDPIHRSSLSLPSAMIWPGPCKPHHDPSTILSSPTEAMPRILHHHHRHQSAGFLKTVSIIISLVASREVLFYHWSGKAVLGAKIVLPGVDLVRIVLQLLGGFFKGKRFTPAGLRQVFCQPLREFVVGRTDPEHRPACLNRYPADASKQQRLPAPPFYSIPQSPL